MAITWTVGVFMATCIFINTYGRRVDAISVSLSKHPDQVQAGSTLSLTCSVDEDPVPLVLVQFQRNNFVTAVVLPVATCYKTVAGTDVYNLTCDHNNRWFKLDILNANSNSHGDSWTCQMVSGAGGPCLGSQPPCVSGPASVFILIPVTTVRLTDNPGNSVTSPVDVSESSNGLILKCNTGPTGSRPVSDISWWKTGDSVSPDRITANVTALPATSLGNDIYISNTRLVVGDRSYNGLNIYCTASQVTSGEVQLNVKWRPNVALQIGGQSYTVYKVPESQTNVVFTCTSGPVNPAITGYSWRHNSNILVNEVTNTYTISSVAQSHDGLYTCSATNVEGTGTSVAMDLDVLYKPAITYLQIKGGNVIDENDSNTTIVCEVDSNPVSHILWTRGGNHSSPPDTGNNLIIPRAQCSDTTIYTCTANNGVGLDVNNSVSLYVNCQSRITPNSPPETTVYGAVGENINVTVQDIIAYPPPTFTWKKVNTDRLPPSNQTDTNTSSTLTLHQLELSTFGIYSVTMDNNIGYPTIFYVTVKIAEPSCKLCDCETSSLAGQIIGAVVGGGTFATVIVLLTVYMWFRCKETRSCAENTKQRAENQTPTDHGAVPVYTNLELSQSPVRRDQQVYEELTQDRDVSISAYQSLNINESTNTV